MAHLLPHVIREAREGPGAAIGAVVGIVVAGVFSISSAPPGCSPADFQLGVDAVYFACKGAAPLLGSIPLLHPIPYALLGILGIVGAFAGHVLWPRDQP